MPNQVMLTKTYILRDIFKLIFKKKGGLCLAVKLNKADTTITSI